MSRFIADIFLPGYAATGLEFVTGILIAYIFAVIIRPQLIKKRSQFYIAVWLVAGLLLLHTLSYFFGTMSVGLARLCVVLAGFGQIAVFLTLVLATGGLSLTQLGGELSNAYEVIRRGETEKTTVIPLTDKQKMAAAERAASDDLPKV